jgi:hypothetical protein
MEVTNAVMDGGSILPIPGPLSKANTSWEVEFLGPALKCKQIDSILHARMRENIHAFMNQDFYDRQYGYLAWSPNSGYWNQNVTTDLPFLSNVGHQHLSFKPVDIVFGGSMLYSINPEVLFYVALLPSVFDAGYAAVYEALNRPKAPVPSWIDLKGIQCQAFEGHYYVAFNYEHSSAKVSIKSLAISTSHPIRPRVDVVGPNPYFKDVNGCQQFAPSNFSNRTRSQCYTNPDILRTLAYQAVMAAFGQNLMGSIYLNWYPQIKRDSGALNTALMNTKDMLFLRDPENVKALAGSRTLQDAVSDSNASMSRGILNKNIHQTDQPLDLALEQMFQNVTISLMSSPALQ